MPDIYVSPHHRKKKKPAKKKKRPKHDGSIFSSFLARPRNIKFETQEEKEEVILLMRRHFATNIPWIFLVLVLMFVPVFLVFFMALGVDILPGSATAGQVFVITLFWYTGVFGFVLVNFFNWYFNIYLVTNNRAIDIDFIGLLYKQFSAAQLDKIEDVKYRQTGFFSSFFDYGDVFIQTAGVEPNFEYTAVSHPDRLVRAIGELIEKSKKR